MALRTANGTWVELQTLSTPLSGSTTANTPRASIGTPVIRG